MSLNLLFKMAVGQGNLETAKTEWEKHRFNINEKDKDGMTPLMMASYQEHVEIVRFLMSIGADPSITNNDGKTALDIAPNPQIYSAITFGRKAYLNKQ